jgi:hypothetical protein
LPRRRFGAERARAERLEQHLLQMTPNLGRIHGVFLREEKRSSEREESVRDAA